MSATSSISKVSSGSRKKVKKGTQDSTRHKLPPPLTPPYPGILGEWVVPSAFKGSQSSTFGCFDCRKCSKRWSTAHARLNLAAKSNPRLPRFFRQGCKQCRQEYLPAYVWQSPPPKEGDKSKKDPTDDKPHLVALCEACRVGQCRSQRPAVKSYSDAPQPSSSTYTLPFRSPQKSSCKLCGRKFNSRQALLTHSQAYHRQPRVKPPSARVD